MIDADAYAAKMKDKQSACREWIEEAKAEWDEAQTDRARQAFATFVEAKLTLDAMPTIDAIPVEWLAQKARIEDGWGNIPFSEYIKLLIWEWHQQEDDE